VSAEDAAQEVFLKAYCGLKSYRGDAAFPTWIYGIAFRHCADVLRSRGRRPTESLPDDLPDPLSSSAVSFESGERLRKLLGALSAEDRNVLVLREVEGLTYEETARVLDCSLDAVKSRLRRARQTALKIAKKRGLYAHE